MGLTPAFSTPAVCSRIFHPCNYARAAFSTAAFPVAPFIHGMNVGLKYLATRPRKPHDPTFISFDALPACDGQTDRQTDRHSKVSL